MGAFFAVPPPPLPLPFFPFPPFLGMVIRVLDLWDVGGQCQKNMPPRAELGVQSVSKKGQQYLLSCAAR